MGLRKSIFLVFALLVLVGLGELTKGEKVRVPKSAIMPALIDYLMQQGVTVKVPQYLEKDFIVVFDELPDLKPEERKLINDLGFKKATLKNIEIKVKLDDLIPVSGGESGGEQTPHYFYLNEENDVRCKIESFQMKGDLKIERKGRDIFGNKLPPLRATIEKFELEDIESLLSFYLRKGASGYYAEDLALKHMVLSSRASLSMREFPPLINKIISDVLGPAIADIGNREVLNDDFYKEFNTNLPPRIPESTAPNLPSILHEILK